MNNSDGVNHWDLPVTEFRPRRAMVRVLSVIERGDPTDPAVEALLSLRRENVAVFDFYRGRVPPASRKSA
jgi:hypothetical protein